MFLVNDGSRLVGPLVGKVSLICKKWVNRSAVCLLVNDSPSFGQNLWTDEWIGNICDEFVDVGIAILRLAHLCFSTIKDDYDKSLSKLNSR